MGDTRTREPRLVISVKPGSEGRVKVDLLDALYPLDRNLQVEIVRGGLAVHSHLDPDTLCDALKRFPIRGVISVKRVIAWVEFTEAGNIAEAIAAKAAAKGVKFSRVEVRSRGNAVARKIEAELKGIFRSKGLLGGKGVAAHVEFLRDVMALAVRAAN